MKEEKAFDTKIKELVNQASTSGHWPKDELWIAIEKKQSKNRKVWYYYAAMLAVLLGFSAYLFTLDTKEMSVLERVSPTDKVTSLDPVTVIEKSPEADVPLSSKEGQSLKGTAKNLRATATIPTAPIIRIPIGELREEEEIVIWEIEEEAQLSLGSRRALEFGPIGNLAPKPISLSERAFEVAILERKESNSSPESKTIYLQIPEKGEKERYSKVGKLFKQIGRFNTVGEFDWEEVNVKPQLIWAYLKESTKSQKDN